MHNQEESYIVQKLHYTSITYFNVGGFLTIVVVVVFSFIVNSTYIYIGQMEHRFHPLPFYYLLQSATNLWLPNRHALKAIS